ncbi:ATP-binding protein [Streptomyces justiciae]|uniref:ATP-binding protein n=1 Tax=Streptomyces justiciae TaxID=2780140 RepID=UPI0021175141|nr:helix-turn-helix transcriptional regulator [Streptomyces justiciae]MCW8382546.1 AAA family ATPase [Streptomyces justiciae]
MLRGRREACAELDGLMEAVRAGASRALVVRGEPGVGKTALLDYAAAQEHGFRVWRVSGVQSEMELAFSGLHQLCAPLADRFGNLPEAQRDALRAALGTGSGQVPDRFLVGLATLGLLADVAQERPLVCLVDDAQWLDKASLQVMAFVARRLVAESVGVVFAARVPDEAAPLAGLPELMVNGLPDKDAQALLRSVLPAGWDGRVVDRIVAETRGNPLALLELARDAASAEYAGGFGTPGGRGLPDRLQELYAQRVLRLPADTRRLLLIAAAEPGGDAALLWRAADRLGIGIGAATPASAAGLVQIDRQVRFHHPLVRSAVYWAASPDERRRAHQALADVTEPVADPDRRAWHAAQAAAGPAEDVAQELMRSADRARERGGYAAAAAFLSRAVELTPHPARRQQRALAAAKATLEAGTPDVALRWLSVVETGPLDHRLQGMVDLLRAQIEFAVERGSDAFPLMFKAARHLETHDVRLARDTYLDAVNAAIFATPNSAGDSQLEAAEVARSAPPAPGRPTPGDLLLDGIATLILEGHGSGVPKLRPALDAFQSPELSEDDALRWLWPATIMAASLWDYDSCLVLSERHVRVARRTGRPTTLPLGLTARIAVHVVAGELTAAAALLEEVESVSEAIGVSFPPYGALLVAAWQGREEVCATLMNTAVAETTRRGEGGPRIVGGWAMAMLHNSLGRHAEALAALSGVVDHGQRDVGTVGVWALVEFIEAAARSGDAARATDIFRRLSERTGPSGTDWALGVEARSRALMTGGRAAEEHYRGAIDRLGRTAIRGELARARLLYGEWLRRERRQRQAREQLRAAHESFAEMGMRAFAQRAERELLATGEKARRRSVEVPTGLTSQETQIVRLVREGLTNPEIGARIFISPRTVEWHLRNIFGKLGVTSRKQLQRADFGLSRGV